LLSKTRINEHGVGGGVKPAPDQVAPGYSSPKRAILELLKQRPGASLQEIADRLGVSKVAVLGHVPALEAEGLLARTYRAGHVGRPRATFRLTDRAAALFPQGYTEMSLCALEFIERRLGPNAVTEVLQERAHELEDRHRARLRKPALQDRVVELVRIRTEGGYMAEAGGRARGTFEIREHNCPILALAARFPAACETERRMFERMLDARVDVQHRMAAGDSVCRFLIRPGRPSARTLAGPLTFVGSSERTLPPRRADT
jgi:DeoR family transcriptional regulator, suf operon transcriptional repressor